jgi:hypothetical protein
VPVVQEVLTDSGSITGLSLDEALQLSSQLNAGRLPVALTVIYEETVSPTLGADFVRLSVMAGIIGILLVIFFMTAYYRVPGMVSSLALLYYTVLLLAIFKLFGVTLTLAAIGGFVVSIGMAVDANVLIFERMKEELMNKRSLPAARGRLLPRMDGYLGLQPDHLYRLPYPAVGGQQHRRRRTGQRLRRHPGNRRGRQHVHCHCSNPQPAQALHRQHPGAQPAVIKHGQIPASNIVPEGKKNV